MREKTSRNEALVKLHKIFPELHYSKLGELFPVDGKPLSKQRVHRILHDTPEKPQNRLQRWLSRYLDKLIEVLD